MSFITDTFGPGGHLARVTQGYEARPQQVQLAEAVDAAISGAANRHLLAEGPCGTGKAFAYLVPAIYRAVTSAPKKKVLVCTANIALQEQLAQKDLPALKAALPWSFEFALLKGRRNYLCLDALAKETATEEMKGALSPVEDQQRSDVVAWSRLTKTGDKSELPFDPSAVWDRFSTDEDCKGTACGHYERCWVTQARRVVKSADVVVCNYHLFFSCVNLLAAGVPAKSLPIPDYDVLICDEAHEMADIARDFLGWRLGFGVFKRLDRILRKDWGLDLKLADAADRFFDAVGRHARDPHAYKIRLRRAGELDSTELRAALAEAYDALDEVGAGSQEQIVERARVLRRLKSAVVSLEMASAPQAYKDFVVFIEEGRRGGRPSLVCKLVDPAAAMREHVWKRSPLALSAEAALGVEDGAPAPAAPREAKPPPGVVLTSATLSTDGAGDFAFVREELGVPRAAEAVVVQSPFNFAAQAMLILPGDGGFAIPDPADPTFPLAVADVIAVLAGVLGGSTMGLFTSYKNLNAAADKLARGGLRVLKQGDAPVTKLVEAFKGERGSVLLGTASLWTGVDVKGDALRAVVIDKMPFPSPADPVMNALEERDPRGVFGKVSLPRAIIALRQGFGRLIRSADDKGVVAILDPRLRHKSYGHKVLSSLPDCQMGSGSSDVAWFMGVAAPPVSPLPEEVPF